MYKDFILKDGNRVKLTIFQRAGTRKRRLHLSDGYDLHKAKLVSAAGVCVCGVYSMLGCRRQVPAGLSAGQVRLA
jgi:hypothetical protein